MDVERGNIEILFRKIPYNYVIKSLHSYSLNHTYENVNLELYLRYASDVFGYKSEDEQRNNYNLMCQQMKDQDNKNPSVFRLITDLARRMLVLDGDEIKCEFEQLLRWREVSLQLGQDFFTCAYLADYDSRRGQETRCFSWLPIIKSNNDRLHNILKEGIAENHFHLNGSTKVFELNWICLMNLIEGRLHDFKKIKCTLQNRCMDRFGDIVEEESFYAECQRAALYRVYLFSIIKEDKGLEKSAKTIWSYIECGAKLEEYVGEIQNLIATAKTLYGAKIDGNILDYALEKSIIDANENECRLLAGERKFLYDCYKRVESGQFTRQQKNMFYMYLMIRTDFRGEIIQINRKVGFANFSSYQDRKEYFVDGAKPYEAELVRLALNESLRKKHVVSLEARICPKKKSSELYKTLSRYEHIVKKAPSTKADVEKDYEKLTYVLHFPKQKDERFVPGVPRNDNVRRASGRQARSIIAFFEHQKKYNDHIRGIDACSSEIFCRPEVFGQVFRYLSDATVLCEACDEKKVDLSYKTKNLHTTYHAGEDFFDIVDGLRAIDETLLFCGFKRGSRLGHALALGIEPYEYYKLKGYKIVLAKQILLDDIVWMYCKANELGCNIDRELKTMLTEKYYSLYEEIYWDNTKEEHRPSMYEYYQSWKLRGDNPEVYKLDSEMFERKLGCEELQRFDRYQFNDKISDDLRKNWICRKLYYFYHFSERVRKKGEEITELKVEQKYIELVRQLQDKMIRQLVEMGIGIETNPSSNYLIGTIKRYEEHPIIRFNSRKLREVQPNMSLNVSINTDDQGVFDTLLENEYALMTLALKKAKDKEANPLYDLEDIYEWIDYVRRVGIEQIFV